MEGEAERSRRDAFRLFLPIFKVGPRTLPMSPPGQGGDTMSRSRLGECGA